jgi:hypothetical protein
VVQSRFVDDPKGALVEADNTVISVMKSQGYPMSDFAQRVPDLYFAQRAADLSVDHANVVQNYREHTKLLYGIAGAMQPRKTWDGP